MQNRKLVRLQYDSESMPDTRYQCSLTMATVYDAPQVRENEYPTEGINSHQTYYHSFSKNPTPAAFTLEMKYSYHLVMVPSVTVESGPLPVTYEDR